MKILQDKTRLVAAAAVVAFAVAAINVSAFALAGRADNEEPITGAALEQASAAAIAHTGGGTITDTEVGDEESYYEVEVTLDDGSQVDVQLDRDFNVVGDEADDDSAGEDGDAD
jgi:uncharacterized membrane protein YkoI